MFGLELVEVAIGLALVFLLLGLIASAITEWIAKIFAIRSKNLEKGIRNLLNDPTRSDDLYKHPIIKGLYKKGWSDSLLDKMNNKNRRGRPSNIPARLFVLTLLDTFTSAGSLTAPHEGDASGGKSRALQTYAMEAFTSLETALKNGSANDINRSLMRFLESAKSEAEQWDQALGKFRMSVEDWYDEAMDRVSGWYKRQTQLIVLAVALVIVAAFNADTITISNALSRDDALRAAAVAAAEQRVQSEDVEFGSSIREVQNELESLNLPIGWVRASDDFSDPREVPTSFSGWMSKILGLFVTALAVSLGAPFWFDALSKIVNLRGSGRVPRRASEERSQAATR